jgi:hydrogenase 3 maturation protease
MTVGRDAARALRDYLRRPTLVLAIGNAWRGDDGAGPALCAEGESGVIDCGDAPERFLGMAGGPGVERVLLVDAMDFGACPGELAFAGAEDLTERAGTTHTTGLAVLMRFVTDTYGKPTAALGIQPADIRFGAPMGAEVSAAVARVGRILAEAGRCGRMTPPGSPAGTLDSRLSTLESVSGAVPDTLQGEAAWTRS